MDTSIERIIKDIEFLSTCNSTLGLGCTRFSYSKEDMAAKEYLMNEMKKLGMDINVDGIGNIRAKYNKSNKPSIMIGSHIDTVLHGGRFDGVVGVVGALEAIRVLEENNIKLEHPIELVIFAEEEGSNFGATTPGSKTLAGGLSVDDLKRMFNKKGESYYEVLKSIGLNPDNIKKERLKSDEVLAMLELHIEQSIVLDKCKIPIGIVKGISGIRLFHVEIQGEPNHAGATPMNMRKDPMVTASKIISSINDIVREHGLQTTVATVGRIECTPNVSNIIPGMVKFTIDIRDVNNQAMERVASEIISLAKKITYEDGLKYKSTQMGESKGILLSDKITSIIEKIVSEKSISYKIMNSGAVHDAALIAGLVDVGMIFIPSKDGRSHVPEEYTSYTDVKLGCDILLETIMRLDKCCEQE